MMDNRPDAHRLACLKQVLKTLEEGTAVPRPPAGVAARQIRETRREIASIERAMRK